MNRHLRAAFPIAAILIAVAFALIAQRPGPPTRDPHTPGYVTAKELPDGTNPPANADGNFILGPTHTRRAGDDRAGRRAAGNGLQLHHGIDRQQNLSRHRPRAQHLRHARSHRSRQARSSPPAIPLPTRAKWPSTSPNNTSPARPRRSSSAPTAPTARCSPRWII